MKTFPSLIGLHVALPCSAPAILLLAATTTDNVVTLTASIQNPALFTISAFPLEYTTYPSGAVVFKTHTGLLARKLMRGHPDIMLKDPSGMQVRVLSFSDPIKVLGVNLFHEAPRFIHASATAAPAVKKAKKKVSATVTDVSGSAVSGSAVVMDVSGSPAMLGSSSTTTTTTTPPPVKRVKPSSSSIILHPFVAKQLLDLAILRHDTCPIVAEEFSANNTAVMPCGHLFARMAIEETFKKEPAKCPACRQIGLPTFI
jgi:hypothetical protein